MLPCPRPALAPAAPCHAALFQGAGTDESVLIEIMATRNNKEIAAINEAYQEGTAREGHRERPGPGLGPCLTLHEALARAWGTTVISGLGLQLGAVDVYQSFQARAALPQVQHLIKEQWKHGMRLAGVLKSIL